MPDLVTRLLAEGEREDLVEQRDRARAQLAAVMRNRTEDTAIATQVRRLARSGRKSIPTAELRTLCGLDGAGTRDAG